ncbi:UNVERIFIED_CONTAM: hypothetical protein PYX00_004875 [Menopon gallinae]
MSNNVDLSAWLKENLQEVLPCLVTDDLVQFILSIQDYRDLEEYMKTLTEASDLDYRGFLANYKKIRSLVDNRNDDEDDSYEYSLKQKDSDKRNKKKGNDPTKDKSSNTKEEKGQKKKTKYVNLYSAEGKEKDVIMLKGRHMCECQASKHKLINNCLNCGRIVCEQEGGGPCLFCNAVVFSKEDLAIINSNSKQSRKLYNSIMESIKAGGLEKALETRDRLLDYDKTSAQRTKVIDDEGEYFSSSSPWLSKQEREYLQKKEEEAHQKKHASRLQKKFTIDFAGRTVEEDSEQFDADYYAELLEKMGSSLNERYTHPSVDQIFEVLYEGGDGSDHNTDILSEYPRLDSRGISYRVQDRELLEMTDNGACLSLHQPWASLLVSGIMRFEGRTWYTSHRGRLWIAAASRHPTEDDIKDAERFFREVRAGEDLQFPKSYPTSVLLGCVSVTDCLPQEEYRQKYPNGECDSPFVFICEDPRQLDTLFPISGSHKIYKLDSKIHQAASKIILRMAKNSKT